MFVLQYKVRPTPQNPLSHEIGGAFVVCWIVAESLTDAKLIAEREVAANHWRIVAFEEASVVDHANREYSADVLELIEQAEIDGEVYQFHTWPKKRRHERRGK